MPFDPDKHHRRSIRLPGYDYASPGAYFVTLCTLRRAPILGELGADTVRLSSTGTIVEQCWLALPRHFPYVTLDTWVIMPDHLHGIVVLAAEPRHPKREAQSAAHGTQSASLSAVLQNFKSVSTRRVNRAQGRTGRTLWQRNYYERIIDDAAGLVAVRRYIEANPIRAWVQRRHG
jgi:REP element-mobilizing transposase RayT